MKPALELELLIIAAFAFAWAWSRILKLELDRLANLAKWSGRYSSSMRDFLAFPVNVPNSLINDLRYWNRAISNKKVPFYLALAISVRRRKLMNGAPAIKIDHYEKDFFSDNPGMGELYMSATVSAVLTISYSHWFWGPIIRAGMADIFAEHQRRKVERFSRAVQREIKLSGVSIPSIARIAEI